MCRILFFIAGITLAQGVQQRARVHAEATQSGLRFFFITDCTAHQRWMAFNVFNSAKLAGQTEPITWVRSGCKTRPKHDDTTIARSFYPIAFVHDVWESGVTRAFHNYLDANLQLSNSTILALIEADMIFLEHFSLYKLHLHGTLMEGATMKYVGNDLNVVGGTTGIAQHSNRSDNLGPPYILTVEAWRKLLPRWSPDQVSFAAAAKAAGLEFNVFEHFVLSEPGQVYDGWALVSNALKSPYGDPCFTKSISPGHGITLPPFMHVGLHHEQNTDHILECGNPLFAEPPVDLAMRTGREGWRVCTILNSLNSMILHYKREVCGNQGYNLAKALKVAPLAWTN